MCIFYWIPGNEFDIFFYVCTEMITVRFVCIFISFHFWVMKCDVSETVILHLQYEQIWIKHLQQQINVSGIFYGVWLSYGNPWALFLIYSCCETERDNCWKYLNSLNLCCVIFHDSLPSVVLLSRRDIENSDLENSFFFIVTIQEFSDRLGSDIFMFQNVP